jgi:integrase
VSVTKVSRSRKGVVYVARWWEDGKKVSRSFRTRKQAEEAERLGRDRARRRQVGLPVERGPITYDSLCETYLQQHQVSAVTKRTLAERLRYSRMTFGAMCVRDIRAESISRWNASLRVEPTTRGHRLRAMRQVLAVGVRWGYLSINPAGPDMVRMPTVPPRSVRPFESWDEVYVVAKHAGPYGSLIVFACATGLRPAEWQALEWRDLDFARREVRVCRTLQDGKVASGAKTDGSLRTVVLQKHALEAVGSLPRPINGRALVFPSPHGDVVNLSNFRRRVWKDALAAAQCEYRPVYECRHTFATLALSAGAPLEWISKQLGHADTRVTLRHYARFLPAADARVLALLDAFDADAGGRNLDVRENA